MTKISRTVIRWFRSDNPKSKIQNRKLVGLLAIVVALTTCGARADAQQPGKIPWIGYLTGSGSSPNQAFVQGMRDLGYVEGKNIGFVYRTAEGKRESYADLAAELVRLKVDIIVTDGTDAALLAKKATSTIAIVMTRGTDPVGAGLVASLARPGWNVTGLTSVTGSWGENFWSYSRKPCRNLLVRLF